MLHEEWTGGRPRCCYLAASHSPPSTQTHRPRYSACSNAPHSDDEWMVSLCLIQPYTRRLAHRHTDHATLPVATRRIQTTSGLVSLCLIQPYTRRLAHRHTDHATLPVATCHIQTKSGLVSLCLIQPHTRRLAHRHTDHTTLPVATCHIQTKSGLVSLYLIQGRYLAATHSTPSTQTHVGGGNVIWRVAGNITLCDPIWHASSRNGEASC